MVAISVLLNVLLRDKHLTYIVSIGTSGGLYFLYSQGHQHWLYNPVLYRLWAEADLTSGLSRIAALRIYCLAMTVLCLWLAHIFFERKSTSAVHRFRRLRR